MSLLAERYAIALYEVTKSKGTSQSCSDSLHELASALESNKDVLDLLSTPLISDNDKEAILKSALAGDNNQELETFLKLLTKNNRLSEIPQISKAFHDKALQEKNVISGKVQSAAELSDPEKNEIKNVIEKQLNSNVDLSFEVNPQIIGGIEAKVGSYIFEDSIKTHMQKLNDFITRRVQ